MKDNGQSPLVPTQLLFSVLEGITAEETPESSSQLTDLHSLQQTVSSQAKTLDYPKDTGEASKLAATGASGGQPSEYKQEIRIFIASNLRTTILFILVQKYLLHYFFHEAMFLKKYYVTSN